MAYIMTCINVRMYTTAAIMVDVLPVNTSYLNINHYGHCCMLPTFTGLTSLSNEHYSMLFINVCATSFKKNCATG